MIGSHLNAFRFLHAGRLYRYDRNNSTLGAVVELTSDGANEDVEPSSLAVAYTVENDLYVARPDAKAPTRITTDGADGIVNGQSVHRQEYGITKGTFWSPKGEQLAFYRMDESMVSTYLLEDIGTKPEHLRHDPLSHGRTDQSPRDRWRVRPARWQTTVS